MVVSQWVSTYPGTAEPALTLSIYFDLKFSIAIINMKVVNLLSNPGVPFTRFIDVIIKNGYFSIVIW